MMKRVAKGKQLSLADSVCFEVLDNPGLVSNYPSANTTHTIPL